MGSEEENVVALDFDKLHSKVTTPAKDLDSSKNEKAPKVGMTFATKDAAQDYYNSYSKIVGFGIRVRSTNKTDGVVDKCVISCNKEGTYKSKKNGMKLTSSTSRCKCSAHILLRLNRDGLWQITAVNLAHNHPVSPSKSKYERSHRKVGAAARKRLAINDEVGIFVSKTVMSLAAETGQGLGGLGFIEKDARNWVDQVRRFRLGVGDAEAIRMYFGRKQQQNSNFFHLMDIDEEGRLRNVFWADARSRTAYGYFSDVITFDTTYVTNRYDMPFAPFVGINHHGQSILLGAGLLSSESVSTYEWLFSTWLTCMYGKAPQAIVTDQCASIQKAVNKIFPNTRHRLCLWHIMKKLPEKLGRCEDRAHVISSIRRVVHDALSPKEFESHWEETIQRLGLHDNDWLYNMYEIRHKWVPAFLNDTFWAGMSSTQRSEGMNAFFDSYVNPKSSLKSFVKQYEVALAKKYHNEAFADFQSYKSNRQLMSCRSYEHQMRSIYTHAMFLKFQDQVRGKVDCTIVGLDQEDEIYIIEVHDITIPEGFEGSFLRVYKVTYVEEGIFTSCTCHLFEFTGILCRHILCVFDRFNVGRIPDRYILNRWRKDYKRLHVSEMETIDFGNHACDESDRHDAISIKCTMLADLGAKNKKKFEKTLYAIQNLIQDLLLEADNESGDEDDQIGVGGDEGQHVHDPNPVRAKGRPKNNVRMKSSIEKKQNKNDESNKKKKRKEMTSTSKKADMPLVDDAIFCDLRGSSVCPQSVVNVEWEAPPILSETQMLATDSSQTTFSTQYPSFQELMMQFK